MRKAKIVATIGPASQSPDILLQMIEAGVNVARFNFSHGNHETHGKWMETVRASAEACGVPVALMIDTKGPEIRLGKFAGGSASLVEGSTFVLRTGEVTGDSSQAWVRYPGIVGDAAGGREILLDDGNIALVVKSIAADHIVTQVKSGGVITDGKKVNLPGCPVSLPSVSEQDMSDILFGLRCGADMVAASFVRKAQDVLDIRRIIEESGGSMMVIAKIESREGVDNLDEILAVADGLMVARGDLGVEIPTEEVPLLQKTMIDKAVRLGKPVITATQMLESMVQRPRPTRAEASDVANAILDGTDAVMLSAETATGRYPVESVKMMARIAEKTEGSPEFAHLMARYSGTEPATIAGGGTQANGTTPASVTGAVSHASCTTAAELGAAAIITPTQSGHTTRMVAKHRPAAPIVAATTDPRLMRRLALLWGTYPVLIEATTNTDLLLERSVNAALASGIVREGDVVVITAGVPVGVPGTTNMMKVMFA
ncbi:MAG: pyruvate kinase [Bacillota bacterium]|nr:pyruvate kinase [Bacillota bacterium]